MFHWQVWIVLDTFIKILLFYVKSINAATSPIESSTRALEVLTWEGILTSFVWRGLSAKPATLWSIRQMLPIHDFSQHKLCLVIQTVWAAPVLRTRHSSLGHTPYSDIINHNMSSYEQVAVGTSKPNWPLNLCPWGSNVKGYFNIVRLTRPRREPDTSSIN